MSLSAFGKNPNEKSLARNKAKGLRKRVENLESAFMISVWFAVLQRFDITNRKLQQLKNTSIIDFLDLYKSVIGLIKNTQENFELYEKAVMKISKT